MSRVLIATPMWPESLRALAGHDLVSGEPGSDASAEALLCDPTQAVDAAAIEAMAQLRVIAVAGAGSDAVDHEAAARREIPVLTAGEALVETTADVAFGLIIAASRMMGEAQELVREGRWHGWRFGDEYGRDVHGATLGLVGFGAIARAVARRAEGFAMHVLHHSRRPTGLPGWREDLDSLLEDSEIVSVHVPLEDSTRGLIDRRRIGLLKEDAVLVNTARGAVVDELALAEALSAGRLLGAGLDVYDGEPGVAPELLAAPRAVLLPHIGSATRATRRGMLRVAAEKVAGVLGG
jgi:lactate dehydrogenase-like 2-hydroxyacid dehydrogenase